MTSNKALSKEYQQGLLRKTGGVNVYYSQTSIAYVDQQGKALKQEAEQKTSIGRKRKSQCGYETQT